MNLFIDKSKCVLCNACTLICPNKAIKISYQKESSRINFIHNRCDNDCHKCLDICPAKAIKLNYHKRMDEFLVETEKCESCGTSISKPMNNRNKNLCVKCKKLRNAKAISSFLK